MLTLFLNIWVYAQINTTTSSQNDDENSLIVMVNLERIRNQILLTEKSLATSNRDMAFAHSYIPHSVIFPSIKGQLNGVNAQSASKLESLLTDLPITIKTSSQTPDSQDKLKNNLAEIESLLGGISKQTIGRTFYQTRPS